MFVNNQMTAAIADALKTVSKHKEMEKPTFHKNMLKAVAKTMPSTAPANNIFKKPSLPWRLIQIYVGSPNTSAPK